MVPAWPGAWRFFSTLPHRPVLLRPKADLAICLQDSGSWSLHSRQVMSTQCNMLECLSAAGVSGNLGDLMLPLKRQYDSTYCAHVILAPTQCLQDTDSDTGSSLVVHGGMLL